MFRFQRDFVWDADAVAFLMDSIYKNYPFGTIQLWRTREELKTEKQFGPFKLFKRDDEYPIDYVLDGQQRITSIFGVFQTDIDKEKNVDNPFNIYFDLLADQRSQDSQFVAFIAEEKIDLKRYFPLNCLFDTVKYRKATEQFSEKEIKIIDQLQEAFKEVKIPYQTLETNDKTKVAIVFERINRKGIPLNTMQLLTAWTWNEEFYLQDKFEDLCDDLKPFGFDDLSSNSDLLLRITSAVLTHDATSTSLINLNGQDIRDRFDEVTNGIKGAIDFVKKNLSVEKLINLPYETLLIPLSVFFANKGNKHFYYDNSQRQALISWFWRVSFSRRYSSGTNSNINKDIQNILILKKNPSSTDIQNIAINLQDIFFISNKFSMNSVNTKSFILLLAQLNPRSFISGSKITLSNVLKEYNKNEFHHIYPKAFVSTLKNTSYDVNCLANFCILSRADNKKIDCNAPSIYRKEVLPNDAEEIFKGSLITEEKLISDNFDEFIKNRAELLNQYLNTLIK